MVTKSGRGAPGALASTLLLLTALTAVSGCGPNLYELPAPPPREAWQRHTLNPAESDDRSAENFRAAKRSLIAFVEAMTDRRFDAAYRMLSNETRLLLDDLSPSGRGEDVLNTGDIQRDGTDYTIDPVDLIVIQDLQDIVDEWPDESESETYRRKELWAVDEGGRAHRVVMIFEEDDWRIHHPRIDLTPGSRGRRTLLSAMNDE